MTYVTCPQVPESFTTEGWSFNLFPFT